MRTTSADNSQRIINAMMPGTIVPIHRHTKTSESMTVLRGRLTEVFFDENGNERGDSIDLSPASYELDIAGTFDWEKIFEEEIQMQVYEEGMYD